MIKSMSEKLAANHKTTKKRIGRGISAGQGKTAGRGTKGQKSRAGHNIPNRFEGGQTVLSMRLPKVRGFKSPTKKSLVITLDTISKYYKNGETVSPKSLKEKGIIKTENEKVKILSTGVLKIKVKVESVPLSSSVKKLLEQSEKKTTESK